MSSTAASTHDVTRLLHAWSLGDPAAADRLMPLIYAHLRGLAREYLRRERSGHTLQPTALVHEAYLRLAEGATVDYRGRAHFYRLAARAMRRILVDHARARQAQRRGGAAQGERVPLTEGEIVASPWPEGEAGDGGGMDFVALDGALGRLAENYPRQGQVVELRFFGGMETRDIAEVLQVTDRTVKRDWQFAKRWLHRELGSALMDDQ